MIHGGFEFGDGGAKVKTAEIVKEHKHPLLTKKSGDDAERGPRDVPKRRARFRRTVHGHVDRVSVNEPLEKNRADDRVRETAQN